MRGEVKALLLGLVFALGLASGALGLRLYEQSRGTSGDRRWGHFDRERYVSRVTQELQLNADQRKELDRILDDTRDEFAKLRETIQPRVGEIKERTRARIRQMLTPDQQQRFEAFLKEWEAERQRRRER
jgi:hypothetical protein